MHFRAAIFADIGGLFPAAEHGAAEGPNLQYAQFLMRRIAAALPFLFDAGITWLHALLFQDEGAIIVRVASRLRH